MKASLIGNTQLALSISRRVDGPAAAEIFAVCRPDSSRAGNIAAQAAQVHEGIRELMKEEGGRPAHVVREWVHFRNIRQDLAAFLAAMKRAQGGSAEWEHFRPASIFVEQPPLDPASHIEVSFHAVIPRHGDPQALASLDAGRACSCTGCLPPSVRLLRLGRTTHLFAAGICGPTGDVFDEAYGMYEAAAALLRRAGMDFGHVVRTWIYLRDIGRDYAEFNRARRSFYGRAGLELFPASTGIGGGCAAAGHNLLMALHAAGSPHPVGMTAMHTPTLNEAASYGSDFSRGVRLADGNKIALLISGTASVDELGRTAHEGDLAGQLERMLENVSTLLAAQGASFEQVVSLTTYLKDPAGAPALLDALRRRRLDNIPNVLVQAVVCRPDLLCEMEAAAALPLPC